MIKLFQKSFKITNENIILTTPLVLFLLLFVVYIEVAQKAPDNVFSVILLVVTTLFMVSAFFAGWLYMVKKAVELNKREFILDEDKTKASFALLKEIPSGVGEYFLSFIGCIIFYVLFFVFMGAIAYVIGIHFIGKVNITLDQILGALQSPAQMKSLITSLPMDQLVKLNLWNFLILAFSSLHSFFTMLWTPEIMFRTKNPFLAFFRALKVTFKNLLSVIILFVYISVLNFVVSIFNSISAINSILYFVSMLVYFYFVVYVVVLVFLYYEDAINKKDKSDSDSGTDSFGQDEVCDRPSEEV